MKQPVSARWALALSACAASVLFGSGSVLLGTCGNFTDVAGDVFCAFVLELFTLGITTGTSPTTFDPSSNVNRLQMAAFVSRTVDAALTRAGRRAALNQFWTSKNPDSIQQIPLGSPGVSVKSDGADLWVTNNSSTVARIRASDGRLLETWTGAFNNWGVMVAPGRIFVTGSSNPGLLYRINPAQTAGAVTTVASNLGIDPVAASFDGAKILTANIGFSPGLGSVSIVTPGATIPWSATTVTTGFSQPAGALFDGTYFWVADQALNALFKVSQAGAILQTVTVDIQPAAPIFDGANIWVPNRGSNSVTVVRASTGTVLDTLTGNGLAFPQAAAFDGQRVLVTNGGGDFVSLWKAADLTTLGFVELPATSKGVCSDGINFWIVSGLNLARF